MKTSKSTRTAALTGILAAIAIFTLVGFYWEDLVVQYHLHRLESEPEHLADVCQMEEPDPAVARAVELFTRTEEGMNRLFVCYVTAAGMSFFLPGLHQKGFREVLVYPSAEDAVSCAYNGRIDTRTSDDPASPSLERVNRFTSCLLGRSFASEEFPGRKFTFITKSEVPPDPESARHISSDVPVLLLIEVEP